MLSSNLASLRQKTLFAFLVFSSSGAALVAQDLQIYTLLKSPNDGQVYPGKNSRYERLKVTIKNYGPEPSPATSSAIYITRNRNAVRSTDYFLQSFATKALRAQETTTVTMNLRIGTGAPGGKVYLTAFADYLNTVAERDERNNVWSRSVVSHVFDLHAMGAASGRDYQFYQGKRMRLTAACRNAGAVTSPVSTATIYLSPDAEITEQDTPIASFSVRALLPYEYLLLSKEVTIPATNHLPLRAHLGMILKAREIEHSGNNALASSPLVTTGDFLPKINAKSLSTTSPRWGDPVTLNIELANKGRRNMPDTKIDLWVQPSPGAVDQYRDWHILDSATVPAYAGPLLRYQHTFTVPNLCAGRHYNLRVVWQVPGHSPRIADLPFVLNWPTKQRYFIGQESPYIRSDVVRNFPVCSKRVGPVSNKMFYIFFMGCSGTAPGLTVPGIGTFHLNWDVCTDIGLGLHGSLFSNMLGLQSFNAAGSVGHIRSGSWLRPLRGKELSLATVYLDANATPPRLAFNKTRFLTIKVK